jgi:protein SCO1/2
MMHRRRASLVALIAIALVLVVAVGARVLVWAGHDHHGGDLIGGPFTLVDGQGRAVTDADFRGRYMLIYFGYTFCPDVCPTSLSLMMAALDKLPPAERAKVVPIFITVDPVRDTPQVVSDYVKAFSPDLVGLSGGEAQIAAAEKAYKVYAAKAQGADAAGYTVDHSSILYLMGPDGRFLAHFTHGTDVNRMVDTLHKFLS